MRKTLDEPKFDETLIASCGMNCGICKAYLRRKNPCHGCNEAEQNWPKTRLNCQLRLCQKRTDKFCYSCDEFPCDRLKRLDKRYRTRYGMSEIDNLQNIRDHGIDVFLKEESKRWISDNGILCVHDKKYYKSIEPKQCEDSEWIGISPQFFREI